jgi:hypothetical protein
MPPYFPPTPGGPARREFARLARCVLLVSGLVAWGCSPNRGGKVAGSVRLDGKPLADAQLSFVPKGEGADVQVGAVVNSAVTDAEGNFEVQRDRAKRTLPPGTYTVLVWKYVQKDGKPPPPEDRDLLIASGMLRNILPERYGSPAASQLTVEVKPGDNALPPLELKSK